MTATPNPGPVAGRGTAPRPLGRCVLSLMAVAAVAIASGCTYPTPVAPTAETGADRLQVATVDAVVVPAPVADAGRQAMVPVGLPTPADPLLPPPAAEALPLDQAVERAAADLFASVPPAMRPGPGRRLIAIDPLVDGTTGLRTGATLTMEQRLAAHVREAQPGYDLRRLDTATLSQAPLVLVGSLRGVGLRGLAPGEPDAYRIWFSLADLSSGKVVGHGMAWARPDGVDPTPTAFFRDSPAWLVDARVRGYLQTCLSKVGEPVEPAYLDGILAAAQAADGVQAYEGGRYVEALEAFQAARRMPRGDQLDVLNGLYLAYWRLGRPGDAEAAFSELVDFGLRHDRLAMRMLFKPASAAFWPDPAVSGPYGMWLRQIARRTEPSGKCLDLVGHTSPTGPAALNERLSLARAEAVRVGLARNVPSVGEAATTRGAGSAENLLGTGRDDASDLLDRRVEFLPVACGASAEARESPGGAAMAEGPPSARRLDGGASAAGGGRGSTEG